MMVMTTIMMMMTNIPLEATISINDTNSDDYADYDDSNVPTDTKIAGGSKQSILVQDNKNAMMLQNMQVLSRKRN